MTSDAHAEVTFGLEYEKRYWLPVPNGFPSADDATVEEWAQRICAEYTIGEPWDASPLRELLPDLLVTQFAHLDPERSQALWYCPYGLPAAGFVEIDVEPHVDGADAPLEQLVAGVRSEIEIHPQSITTTALGDGIAFSLVVEDTPATEERAAERHGEIVYAFQPPGAVLVVRMASADDTVLSMMAADARALIESVVVR